MGRGKGLLHNATLIGLILLLIIIQLFSLQLVVRDEVASIAILSFLIHYGGIAIHFE